MGHTLKIKSFGVEIHPEGDLTSVLVEISDGVNEPVLKRFGYPLGTSKEAVEADLKNVVAGLDSDAATIELHAEREAKLKQVDEMREELEGKEIVADASESSKEVTE